MNGLNPRERLGFAEAVTELFRFLETDYGYRQTHADSTSVAYKSRDLEIRLWHDFRSGEVELYVAGGRGSQKWKYHLPEILRGLAPDYPGKGIYQTMNKDLLRESLADMAGLIHKYGDGLVRGAREAGRLVEAAHREEARKTTEYYTISPVKEKADAAWKRREYREVIALYASIESHLSSLERQRLDYARRHSAGGRD